MTQPSEPDTGPPAEIYGAEQITVLKGLEAVRVRPSMYIGDTSSRGLHHLAYEVIDNAIDEAMAGYCTEILVRIEADGSCTVRDNGRGIPVGMHPTEGKPGLEVALTMLHAGGKFDRQSYKVSGGLHGVGVSVVNALSEWLEVEVMQGGGVHVMRFERGNVAQPLQRVGSSRKTGTRVQFKPDSEIFSVIEFNYETLLSRLRELAYLNEGLLIRAVDERVGREEEFRFEEGIRAFVRHLNEGKQVLHDEVVFFRRTDEEAGLICEVAIQYNDGYAENIYSFANNINTIEGGTHTSGFKSALTRSVNAYARKRDLLRKEIVPTGEDLREGLTAIVSVKVPEPQFEGQTKTKLGNSEVGTFVETTVNEMLSTYLEENPGEARKIINKASQAAAAREAARRARELTRKQAMTGGHLPGKLSDCRSTSREDTELFLVEGDSAAGPAKQGRDSNTQAIMPLRGKILNVEKARVDKMLAHEEIRNIIIAVGAGIGSEEFDADKCRYGRIVIMTDADVDGSHIRTLLLTFLFRYMRPLIDQGRIFIAQPPLYQLARGRQKPEYVLDDAVFNSRLAQWGLENTRLEVRDRQGTMVIVIAEDVLPGLMQLIEDITIQSEVLRRRGIDFELFTREYLRGEKLPVVQASLDDETHYFYSEDDFVEFRREAEQRLGVVELEEGSRRRGPVEGSDSGTEPGGNGHHLAKIELSESRRLNKLIGLLREMGLEITDYFLQREETVAGESVPCKFTLIDRDEEAREVPNLPEIVRAIREQGARGLEIKRFKGLGEMNAEELWQTTMDPEQRTLRKVVITSGPDQAGTDGAEAERIISILMGEDVERRREFIEVHATEVKNLDI